MKYKGCRLCPHRMFARTMLLQPEERELVFALTVFLGGQKKYDKEIKKLEDAKRKSWAESKNIVLD